MHKMTIDKVINEFNKLPLEDEAYLIEIMQKQMVEKKRDDIFHRGQEAENNFKKGLYKKGKVEDLYKDIESD